MDILAAIEYQESLAQGRGDLNTERAEALDRYLGRPYGDEQDGRSAIVMRDVADTVEWIKPSLLKIFASGDEVVRFDPTGPEDEEQAQQETDYVNYVVNQKNNGFIVFHDWFHDALLQKTGYVLVQHVTEKEQARESYKGLSDDEMALLGQEAEILYHTPIQVTSGGIGPNGEQIPPVVLHDVVIRQTKDYGCIKLSNIPPEQVLVASDWPHLHFEGCPFLEVIDYPLISDLRQRGYDVDDTINDDSDNSDDADFRQRRSVTSDQVLDQEGLEADPATRRVRCRYVWMQFDEDGDGIAELKKVTVVGKTILENEETDLIPVAALTPIRQPHEHYGLSIDDIVQDLQRIRTVLVRGFLDNMYLTNNGRNAIDANRVNLDDMLVSRPGGVVRVNGDPGNAVFPLIHPQNGPAILQAVEYVDGVRESRTGITKYNQGLDANSLNKTAHGISQIMTAAQQRIEMIARIFAETGVKSLMLIVHAMSIKNGSSQDKMKLRNKWVPVDPRGWKTRKDLTVAVGLGTGNKDQMLQHLMMILQAQKEALPLGITGPKEIYNALARLTQNAGFKQAEEFWKDPGDNAQLPTPPNPEVIKAEADAKKTQAQLQADAQKTQATLQADAQKFQAEAAMKRMEMEFQASEAEKDRQLEIEKVRATEATKIAIAQLNDQRTVMMESARMESEKATQESKQTTESAKQVDETNTDVLGALAAAMQALSDAMSRPKTIIRGPDGKAIGVQ